jgi:outer membrane protein OmpA-like peptidoglycan-associated protein/tetratricopeptide (TPR) repeat protein
MKYLLFFFSFLLIFSATSCKAQDNKYKYTTKSAKAIKAYESATLYYDKYDNEDALKELDNAIKFDENFIEAYMLKADIYADLKKYELAAANYKKAIDLDPDFFANNYLNLGMIELFTGKYADAKTHLTTFINNKNANIVNVKRAQFFIKDCDFGINAVNNPVPFNPKNLGDSVNSKYSEYLPSVTADEQELVITRRLPIDKITSDNKNTEQEDFYVCKKVNDSTWSKARDLGPPVNTSGNEGAQCLSPDGKSLYFTACNRADGVGSCDLYYSEKIGNAWTIPKNMGTVVNSERWDSQPSISSDGNTLYFTSARNGGKGGMDIWKTTKDDKGVWGTPVDLGDSINTTKGEMAPFIHPDDQTLYFASNGHQGMGDFDIFYSRKDSSGNWGKPVNIGYPINTYSNDSYLIVNANGDLAYFSSDREGGKGGMDIYTFPLYEKARPKRVTYLKGSVFNKVTKDKLEAKFELVDLSTGKTYTESFSDKVTGEFLVCLPTEKDYALNVSKDGYLFYSENFSLTGIHSNSDPFLKDIPLQPIKKDEIVILKNIFFDTDKYELKAESTSELEKLQDLLTKNPKLKIEISGHTDNVGDDKYNQVLSENRAKAVYDYLVSKGIAKERLTYKGYGETKPLETNDTDAGRAINRRTEFKVVDITGK